MGMPEPRWQLIDFVARSAGQKILQQFVALTTVL
jgi:hypothetical protein